MPTRSRNDSGVPPGPSHSQKSVTPALRHEGLTVFSLLINQASGLEYLVSDEAIEGGSTTVEEVSEAEMMTSEW